MANIHSSEIDLMYNMIGGDFMSFKKGFFSKVSWVWGATFGALLSGMIAYAALTMNIFSPGTPIVAAEVNQNFQQITDKINETSYGVVAKLSANQNMPMSSQTNFILDLVVRDDAPGAYNPATGVFTVPAGEGGFYTVYYKYRFDVGAGSMVEYKINSSPFGLDGANATVVAGNKTFYLEDGDTFEIYLNEFKGTPHVLQAADTVFFIKREAKL